jgi:hypothetical protein
MLYTMVHQLSYSFGGQFGSRVLLVTRSVLLERPVILKGLFIAIKHNRNANMCDTISKKRPIIHHVPRAWQTTFIRTMYKHMSYSSPDRSQGSHNNRFLETYTSHESLLLDDQRPSARFLSILFFRDAFSRLRLFTDDVFGACWVISNAKYVRVVL